MRNCSSVGRLVLAASRFTSSRSTDEGWYFTSCRVAAMVMCCLPACVHLPAALYLVCACVTGIVMCASSMKQNIAIAVLAQRYDGPATHCRNI
jgi:hypothetical protein